MNRLQIKLLSFSFTISFVGLMFPYGFPFFSLLILLMLAIFVITKKKIELPSVSGLEFFFLLQAIFIISYFLSTEFYKAATKDLVNAISVNLFVVMLFLYLKETDAFFLFKKYFAKYLLIICSLVSIVSMYKLMKWSSGVEIEYFRQGDIYPIGSSLVTDYNFFSLGMISGLLFGYYFYENTDSKFYRFISMLAFLPMIASVLTSSSRRGLIFIIIILLFFLFKNIFIRTSFKNIVSITLGLIVFLFISTKLDISTFDSDNITKMTSRLETIISEDSEDDISLQRTVRWNYAYYLFSEKNVIEMLLGSGFDYLEKFKQEFVSQAIEDYPHNFFLSHLLFSGVFGVIVLILFLKKVFNKYFLFRKELKTFFYVFFVFLMFMLTSANTIYSVKPFLLLLLIPFIFHKIKYSSNGN